MSQDTSPDTRHELETLLKSRIPLVIIEVRHQGRQARRPARHSSLETRVVGETSVKCTPA